MDRAVLAVFISLLYLFAATPTAWANTTSGSTAHAKKSAGKKTSASKRKKVRRASSAKRRTASRHRAKSSVRARGKLIRKVVTVRGKRKVIYTRVPARRVARPVLSAGDLAGLNRTDDPFNLASNAALVLDPATSEILFEKNSDAVLPIASITKLMTALVVLEAHQKMDEVLTVTKDDIDHIKHTSSRLRVGSSLTRANMLHIALMSSENRAASALGRNYPGGLSAFVAAMNAKARALGMTHTQYVEPTGLSSQNVSSPRDLAKLVLAAQRYPLIREYSTNTEYEVEPGGRTLQYRNSNRLVKNPDWDIVVQKTGYIVEAGRCLVMQAVIEDRPIVMVFLDSKGKYSRVADAGRIRKWLEKEKLPELQDATLAESKVES